MTSDVVQRNARCREIGESDIEGIIDLLLRGFPFRSRQYWAAGFARLKALAPLRGFPHYGFMVESAGKPVGVVLTLFTTHEVEGEVRPRCNLSSWYVDPRFGSYTATLILFALRHKQVTYTTISSARHTLRTVEAARFRPYATGQFFSIPVLHGLRGRGSEARIHRILADTAPGAFADLPERNLLMDHAAMGCLSLVVEAPDGLYPFVFLRFRIWSGLLPLPFRQLVYCRDVANYVRFAGAIGRFLIRRGVPVVIHDSNGPVAGLAGHFRKLGSSKYFRGPHAPRLGDLAYTERVVFGP